MSSKRSHRFVGAAAVALACSVAAAPLASAAAPAASVTPHALHLTKAEETRMHDFFVSNGVTEATSQKLIHRWESGYAIDSATGKKPTKTTIVSGADGSRIQWDTYADGSVATTSMPNLSATTAAIKSGMSQTMKAGTVGGCDSKVSDHYTTTAYGCLVDRNAGYMDMRFRADYQLIANAHVSKIMNAYTLIIVGAGLNFDDKSLTVVRGTQTSQQKAQAHAQTTLTGSIPVGVTSVGLLDLYVADTSATASANF